ncbi:hypothetical protein [Halobacillus seohaensis]|uniref:Uncharacterized protein n=1 Tax=Halobacillus seohaensis TaxID=447421 RepID=A0ABW2ELI2_9BACI
MIDKRHDAKEALVQQVKEEGVLWKDYVNDYGEQGAKVVKKGNSCASFAKPIASGATICNQLQGGLLIEG